MLHKWLTLTFEESLRTFIRIEYGPVTFLGFRDCKTELISLTVALGKSKEFECFIMFFVYLHYTCMIL